MKRNYTLIKIFYKKKLLKLNMKVGTFIKTKRMIANFMTFATIGKFSLNFFLKLKF